MTDILLVSNPSHMGVTFIADAYNRAFQYLGVDFDYFEFRKDPKLSAHEANSLLMWKMFEEDYKIVIMVQPTFLLYTTFYKFLDLKKDRKIKFYCINTEDPYSSAATVQMNELFDIKYTNEKIIADMYKALGFIYLPVAFDSLFSFKTNNTNERKIDICYISTFYGSRLKYLEALNSSSDNMMTYYVTGNLAPLIELEEKVDTKLFQREAGMMSRHKELETYSHSKIVLNPHREVNETGYEFLRIERGIKCKSMIDNAVSPNPRFFDAVACGAMPLNDLYRKECFNILEKYDIVPEFFKLPKVEQGLSVDWFGDILKIRLEMYDTLWHDCTYLDFIKGFVKSESYIERAKKVLENV